MFPAGVVLSCSLQSVGNMCDMFAPLCCSRGEVIASCSTTCNIGSADLTQVAPSTTASLCQHVVLFV